MLPLVLGLYASVQIAIYDNGKDVGEVVIGTRQKDLGVPFFCEFLTKKFSEAFSPYNGGREVSDEAT